MNILNEILNAIIAYLTGFLIKQIIKKRKNILAFIKYHLKLIPIFSERPFYCYCRIAAAIMPTLGFIQVGIMYSENAALYKMALIGISFIYNYVLFTAIGDDLFKRLNLIKV